MNKTKSSLAYAAAVTATALSLLPAAGCGDKGQTSDASAPAAAPSSLSPQAQSAMDAQQKAEAASRAAHAQAPQGK